MFNNPELNTIMNCHNKSIKSHQIELNQLSDDIKMIESILKEAPVVEYVVFHVDEQFALTWKDKHIWVKTPSSKKRILETPAHVRLKCKQSLASFLDKCLKTIAKE